MSSPRPILVVSVARSGGNLLCRMLSAHQQIVVAGDALLPLYRSFRNAVVRKWGIGEAIGFDADSPFQDYYFSPRLTALLDLIQQSELISPFDQGELPELREQLKCRFEAQCADLIPLLSQVGGRTYLDLLDSCLRVISLGRDGGQARWVGAKDVWTIEFMRPLARASPEARFIVLVRDPRGVIASMLALGRTQPQAVAQPLSYARHWRKQFAFVERYRSDPDLSRRLMLVRYEDLTRAPAQSMRRLCGFLDLEYDDRMTDPSSFIDYATGERWRGNSSFVRSLSGISRGQNQHWQVELRPPVRMMIELGCGREMQCLGYTPQSSDGELDDPSPVLGYLQETAAHRFSWRSDLGEPQADYEAERSRRAMLYEAMPEPTAGRIRSNFLFTEVYSKLRHTGQEQSSLLKSG